MGLPDAAFVVDGQGRVIVWNEAARDLLGWEEGAALTMQCSALLEGVSLTGQFCTPSCRRIVGLTQDPICPVVGMRRGDRAHPERMPARGPHPDLRVHAIDGRSLDLAIVDLPITLDGRLALLHILRQVPSPDRDALTGLPGRRELTEAFEVEQSRSRRLDVPLSLAVVDIDGLKQINDVHGHDAGDRAIVAGAHSLEGGRRHDHVGRWGGDEFVVILSGADVAQAAGRLRRSLDELRGREIISGLQVSWSAGVTAVEPEEEIGDAVRRADTMLYRAKIWRAGVCTEQDPPNVLGTAEMTGRLVDGTNGTGPAHRHRSGSQPGTA